MTELAEPSHPVEGIVTMRSFTARPQARRYRFVCLRVQRLEDRALPSATLLDVYPVIMAGYLKGSPADSPGERVDPNTVESPFAGVGSILISTAKTTRIGTGAAIGPRHILTAAHVVDLNADGRVDAKDGTNGVYFVLNYGENLSHRIAVSEFDLHPDFTGFNRPAVNDDIAVLTLAEDLPEGVPIYSLPTSDLLSNTQLTMVGYGRSGNGVQGYTTLANPTVKRVGGNMVDGFYGQDDRDKPAANEVFRFDFDGPKGNGLLGGPTLGNDVETQLGSGDSGGPSFVVKPDGGYVIVGVNSFVQGLYAPKFGSMGGGMNVYSYLSFIASVLPAELDRDLEITADPLPVNPLPINGPTPIPLTPAKAGILIGAKPVSFEMPTFAEQTIDRYHQSKPIAWAFESDETDDTEPTFESRLFESDELVSTESIDSFDLLSIGGLVSVDVGLFDLVPDGSMAFEE
jgi:hypothetical protein